MNVDKFIQGLPRFLSRDIANILGPIETLKLHWLFIDEENRLGLLGDMGNDLIKGYNDS